MTLHDIARMTYELTVDHCINDVHFGSIREMETAIKHWLISNPSRYIASVNLPDGTWLIQYSRSGRFYDIFVPETRTQETRLTQALLGGK